MTALPATALAAAPDVTGVPVQTSPLVHRTELVHGTLATTLASDLAAALLPSP